METPENNDSIAEAGSSPVPCSALPRTKEAIKADLAELQKEMKTHSNECDLYSCGKGLQNITKCCNSDLCPKGRKLLKSFFKLLEEVVDWEVAENGPPKMPEGVRYIVPTRVIEPNR